MADAHSILEPRNVFIVQNDYPTSSLLDLLDCRRHETIITEIFVDFFVYITIILTV